MNKTRPSTDDNYAYTEAEFARTCALADIAAEEYASRTETFTISLRVSMAFEDNDHYAPADVETYLRHCLNGKARFPGGIETIDVQGPS